MGLAPGEQRTLTEIESRLRRTDPNLAVAFALFGSQGFQRRGRVIRITAFAVVAALLATCLALGIYLA